MMIQQQKDLAKEPGFVTVFSGTGQCGQARAYAVCRYLGIHK